MFNTKRVEESNAREILMEKYNIKYIENKLI